MALLRLQVGFNRHHQTSNELSFVSTSLELLTSLIQRPREFLFFSVPLPNPEQFGHQENGDGDKTNDVRRHQQQPVFR